MLTQFAFLKKLSPVSFFIWTFLLIAPPGTIYDQAPGEINAAYYDKVQKVLEYKDVFELLHPFIQNTHPIAIAEEGYFYVFDLDEGGEAYGLKAWEETGMYVPQGVRAAFSLPFYENRCACVVSGDAFDSIEGYIMIFHEFIHCHQWNTVEPGLRAELPLAVRMTEEENFMWEIEYPFPYDDEWFVRTYAAFVDAFERGEPDEALWLRHELQNRLKSEDFQYMVWQEWKEGFALYIENLLRKEMGLERNMVGRSFPFSRTVFYAGGEAYIRHLIDKNPVLNEDIEALFVEMYYIDNR